MIYRKHHLVPINHDPIDINNLEQIHMVSRIADCRPFGMGQNCQSFGMGQNCQSFGMGQNGDSD
jgi:hypothetical protein